MFDFEDDLIFIDEAYATFMKLCPLLQEEIDMYTELKNDITPIVKKYMPRGTHYRNYTYEPGQLRIDKEDRKKLVKEFKELNAQFTLINSTFKPYFDAVAKFGENIPLLKANLIIHQNNFTKCIMLTDVAIKEVKRLGEGLMYITNVLNTTYKKLERIFFLGLKKRLEEKLLEGLLKSLGG